MENALDAFTLRDLYMILGGVIALAVAWGSIKSELRQLHQGLSDARNTRDRHDERLRHLETGQSTIVAKLEALGTMLLDVRELLRSQRER